MDDRQVRGWLAATYYCEGRTYQEISSLLDISVTEVSRAITRAKPSLTTEIKYPSEEIKLAVMNSMRCPELEAELKDRFKTSPLRQVIVAKVNEPGKHGNKSRRRKILARLSRVLSFWLLRHIEAAKSELKIAVSWGNSVSETVRAIEELTGLEMRKSLDRRHICFNCAGDVITRGRSDSRESEKSSSQKKSPQSEIPLHYWASDSARRLAVALGGDFLYAHAPAWIPVDQLAEDPAEFEHQLRERRREIVCILSRYPGYGSVFDREGEFKLLPDLLLTGIGTQETLKKFIAATIGMKHPVIRRLLTDDLAGDLSGVILTRRGDSLPSIAKVLPYALLGPSPKAIQDIARKGAREGYGGIVAIATGRERYEAVISACQFTNVLAIDEELAREVIRRCGKNSGNPP